MRVHKIARDGLSLGFEAFAPMGPGPRTTCQSIDFAVRITAAQLPRLLRPQLGAATCALEHDGLGYERALAPQTMLFDISVFTLAMYLWSSRFGSVLSIFRGLQWLLEYACPAWRTIAESTAV